MDVFHTYYYDQDHLGNIRQVTDKSGKAVQTTDYYPFGMQLCDGTTSSFDQNHKYNGQGSYQRVQTSSLSLPSAAEAQPKVKEFVTMHGLNTYDYGARQYNPVTARWDRMDPLCEKYYSVSPYAYCGNNPVNAFDVDGRDGVKIIDAKNKTITLKAHYYVDTKTQTCEEFDGNTYQLNGYSQSDIQELNSYDNYLNELNLNITEGEYKGYSLKFDLNFAGSTDATKEASKDMEQGISIGNTISKGNYDSENPDRNFKQDAWTGDAVGGYTENNN